MALLCLAAGAWGQNEGGVRKAQRASELVFESVDNSLGTLIHRARLPEGWLVIVGEVAEGESVTYVPDVAGKWSKKDRKLER